MLAAERHGKISPARSAHERMEDVLTSHVFSLYRYLNNLQVGAAFLGCAMNLAEEHLSVTHLHSAQVVFWPKFSRGERRREADVLLLLEEGGGEKLVVLVEAKHEAGLHNLESENEAQAQEVLESSGHQLANEFEGLISGVWHLPEGPLRLFHQTRRRVLLFVTAHHELPRTDLEEAVRAVRVFGASPGLEAENPQPARDIYWISWRALHTLLVSASGAGFPGYTISECNFLEDLQAVLAIRRLREFQPLQGLKPVDTYKRLAVPASLFVGLEPIAIYQSFFDDRLRELQPLQGLKPVGAYKRLAEPPSLFVGLEPVGMYQSISG